MTIHFICPRCDRDYSVSDRYAGREFACKSCGRELKVPRPGGTPTPPRLRPAKARASQPPRTHSRSSRQNPRALPDLPPREAPLFEGRSGDLDEWGEPITKRTPKVSLDPQGRFNLHCIWIGIFAAFGGMLCSGVFTMEGPSQVTNSLVLGWVMGTVMALPFVAGMAYLGFLLLSILSPFGAKVDNRGEIFVGIVMALFGFVRIPLGSDGRPKRKRTPFEIAALTLFFGGFAALVLLLLIMFAVM